MSCGGKYDITYKLLLGRKTTAFYNIKLEPTAAAAATGYKIMKKKILSYAFLSTG